MRILWGKGLSIVLGGIDCSKNIQGPIWKKYAWRQPAELKNAMIFALAMHEPIDV